MAGGEADRRGDEAFRAAVAGVAATLVGAAVHPPHGLTLRQSSEKPTEGEVSRFALR